MRTIIGILVFVVWSSASTYWYVCKIKEICKEEKAAIVEPIKQEVIEKTEPEKTQVHFDFNTLTIYFPYAKASTKLSQGLTDSIKIFSEKLILAEKLILVVGNTDNVGSSAINMDLGLERAKWVKELFVINGINENNIEIKSFGKEHPIENNNTKSGRSKNRRVEINIQNK